MTNAQRLIDFFIFLVLCVPLIFSILFMTKSLIRQTHNKSTVGTTVTKEFFVLKMLLIIVMIIIGSFLLLYLSVSFLFPDYEIPTPLNLIGIVLSGLYILGFGGVVMGLGQIGHGGGSPTGTIRELFRRKGKQ
jgi:hypothetical protein